MIIRCWIYPMVDYLMALNLHNVMVASRLENIVTFTVSAAVTDGLLSENRFPFLVFPVLHFSTSVPCDSKPTHSDESHSLNSIAPTIYAPPGSPGSPFGPGGPCGPIAPPGSPYRKKDKENYGE